MDESHAQELATWSHEAREHGLPVLLTGFVLFRVELGLPPWSTVLLGLLMAVVLLVTAYVTFGPGGTASRDW